MTNPFLLISISIVTIPDRQRIFPVVLFGLLLALFFVERRQLLRLLQDQIPTAAFLLLGLLSVFSYCIWLSSYRLKVPWLFIGGWIAFFTASLLAATVAGTLDIFGVAQRGARFGILEDFGSHPGDVIAVVVYSVFIAFRCWLWGSLYACLVILCANNRNEKARAGGEVTPAPVVTA